MKREEKVKENDLFAPSPHEEREKNSNNNNNTHKKLFYTSNGPEGTRQYDMR
jgi:hypothetical protein